MGLSTQEGGLRNQFLMPSIKMPLRDHSLPQKRLRLLQVPNIGQRWKSQDPIITEFNTTNALAVQLKAVAETISARVRCLRGVRLSLLSLVAGIIIMVWMIIQQCLDK